MSDTQILTSQATTVYPFHSSEDGQVWVSYPQGAGYRNCPLHHPDFAQWLTVDFAPRFSRNPSNYALAALRRTLASRALDRTEPTAVRLLQPTPDSLAIDLGDPACQTVHISTQGWSVSNETEFYFRRPAAAPAPAAQLPNPIEAEAGLPQLQRFLRLKSHSDWLRLQAWLFSALEPHGPYPVLLLEGPRCSGKTTAARFLRALIDPAPKGQAELPSAPSKIYREAYHNRLLAYDNVTHMSTRVTDTLCHISTGVAYQDRPEHTGVNLRRPILLTTQQTENTWTPRPDLEDRVLRVELEAIDNPIPEAELTAEFEQARPAILAALFNAAATALGRLSETHLAQRPRMAEAATWVAAGSPWLDGPQDDLVQALFPPPPPALPETDDTPGQFLTAVAGCMQANAGWSGTATALIAATRSQLADKSVTQVLRQRQAALAALGLRVTYSRESLGRRIIHLRRISQQSTNSVTQVAASAPDRRLPASPQAPKQPYVHRRTRNAT